MLALVLRCNNFGFNNDHYLQIQGVAMGTRSTPTIANLVMGDFEVKHVYTYPKQPYLWIRFIDNNIGIWLHGLHELQEFFKYLNSCHSTIKFTFEFSETSIPFLDTNTTIGPDGIVYATLYFKPTDTHPYLPYQSCHPHHHKNWWPLQSTAQSQENLYPWHGFWAQCSHDPRTLQTSRISCLHSSVCPQQGQTQTLYGFI